LQTPLSYRMFCNRRITELFVLQPTNHRVALAKTQNWRLCDWSVIILTVTHWRVQTYVSTLYYTHTRILSIIMIIIQRFFVCRRVWHCVCDIISIRLFVHRITFVCVYVSVLPAQPRVAQSAAIALDLIMITKHGFM